VKEIVLNSYMQGINSALVVEEEAALQTFRRVEVLAIVIICILFLIFYVSLYYHKMIGLETIHVMQVLYFARMVASSKSTSLLNSFNMIQYSATGFS